MALLVRRREVIPFSRFAEALRAAFERLLPAVLDLPLVAEERSGVLDGAADVREQRIEVDLHAVELRLEQRTEAEFVAFAPVVRQLEFGDEAHVDRILAGLGQLELVLELDGIERRVRTLARTLDVELGEPPLLQSVTETEACRLRGGLVFLAGGAVLEVDLPLAVTDGG